MALVRPPGPQDCLGGGAAGSILLAEGKTLGVTGGSPEFPVPLTVVVTS